MRFGDDVKKSAVNTPPHAPVLQPGILANSVAKFGHIEFELDPGSAVVGFSDIPNAVEFTYSTMDDRHPAERAAEHDA